MITAGPIEYGCNGETMIGRLAVPDADGPRPAVLVAHEGPGLDYVQRHRADALAELGYVALAIDYHGGGRWIDDREEMRARLEVLGSDPDLMRGLGQAGLDVLLGQPTADPTRVAAIGYCFGATIALELGRSGADLKAIVGFHPGLGSPRPRDSARIKGSVLLCVGADDPMVPAPHRAAFEAEMSAAGVDWRINLYGGTQHSFTHPAAIPERLSLPGIAYHELNAQRSWRAMLDLFDEVLA